MEDNYAWLRKILYQNNVLMEGVPEKVDMHQAKKLSFWSLTEDDYVWFSIIEMGGTLDI